MIRIGISSCLLGEPVRYDGQHKLDRYLRDVLGQYVEYVPVCPEYECGLGVPREAMRLVGDPEAPRLVTIRSATDLTERMQAWAEKRVAELDGEGLCGFVFKSKSPSSGLHRVKVYNAGGAPRNAGRGLFAAAFTARNPLLPVEEEGRLHDARLRENFIEAIFTMQRWRDALAAGLSRRALVDFHTCHKLLIMSHSPEWYRKMGRLVAAVADAPLPDVSRQYETMLLQAIRLSATPSKHVNVLQHIAGHFKRHLSGDEKQELQELIHRFRAGTYPLIVPITLLNHYVRKYQEPYLARQIYLHPHPTELALRNHV